MPQIPSSQQFRHSQLFKHRRPLSELWPCPLFRIRLPLPGILHSLRDARHAAFHARPDVGDAVAQRLADAARGACHGLADPAGGCAEDPAHGICQPADRVAEGRGDDFGGAGGAGGGVFVGGGHDGGKGLSLVWWLRGLVNEYVLRIEGSDFQLLEILVSGMSWVIMDWCLISSCQEGGRSQDGELPLLRHVADDPVSLPPLSETGQA